MKTNFSRSIKIIFFSKTYCQQMYLHIQYNYSAAMNIYANSLSSSPTSNIYTHNESLLLKYKGEVGRGNHLCKHFKYIHPTAMFLYWDTSQANFSDLLFFFFPYDLYSETNVCNSYKINIADLCTQLTISIYTYNFIPSINL